MLSYAYQALQFKGYKSIQTESFDNVQDLFAAILAKGVQHQIKQGVAKEYIEMSEALSTLRGKIDISATIKCNLQRNNKLVCCYDELSENNQMNQILKTTANYLIFSDQVKKENKAALKRAMLFFSNVDTIDPKSIRWGALKYHRNNQTYRLLMNICYLVLSGLILTTDKGEQKLATFLDDQAMSALYEKFVLEFFKKHYPMLNARAMQISWDVDDDVIKHLPVMKTDITLSYKGKTLIIDAKYYSHSMQTRRGFDSLTIHSNNLYQIFTYVKNHDKRKTGNVAGMLLYAKTDEAITPDVQYQMSGNTISVKTLDLNCPFQIIKEQLERIAESLIESDGIAVG